MSIEQLILVVSAGLAGLAALPQVVKSVRSGLRSCLAGVKRVVERLRTIRSSGKLN